MKNPQSSITVKLASIQYVVAIEGWIGEDMVDIIHELADVIEEVRVFEYQGFVVHLRPGYTVDGEHHVSGDTPKNCREQILSWRPCKCKECARRFLEVDPSALELPTTHYIVSTGTVQNGDLVWNVDDAARGVCCSVNTMSACQDAVKDQVQVARVRDSFAYPLKELERLIDAAVQRAPRGSAELDHASDLMNAFMNLRYIITR